MAVQAEPCRHDLSPRQAAFLERIAYGTSYLNQISVVAVAEGLYLHWASSMIAEVTPPPPTPTGLVPRPSPLYHYPLHPWGDHGFQLPVTGNGAKSNA